MDCIPSGVDFLDQATGGFHRKKPYFVLGASGTGKSILGLQYVTAGLSRGEGALYVCRERAEDLIEGGAQLVELVFPIAPEGLLMFGQGLELLAQQPDALRVVRAGIIGAQCRFDGQQVHRTEPLQDGDTVEIHE